MKREFLNVEDLAEAINLLVKKDIKYDFFHSFMSFFNNNYLLIIIKLINNNRNT